MDQFAEKQKRKANIELLRIISMAMVLVLHALSGSGALEYLNGINYWVYWWMEALCIIAVDIFVLISGYFLVESRFKAKNIFKIAWGVWIYSIIFSSINLIISGEALTLNYLIRMILPFTTKKFWFVNSYIALYLLSPFMNKLIHSLSKKQFSALVVIMVIMFSLRVTFLPITWSQDATGGMGILSFLTLYCMAAWLRLYYKKRDGIFKYLAIYLGISILLPVSKKVMLMIGFNKDFTGKLYGYPSIFVYAEAVALFLVFLNMKQIEGKVGKVINIVAEHSFSVYIIHFAMVGVLFTDILHLNLFIDSFATGFIAIVLSVIVIYVFCTCVDVVKSYVSKKIYRKITNTEISQKCMWLLNRWDSIIN